MVQASAVYVLPTGEDAEEAILGTAEFDEPAGFRRGEPRLKIRRRVVNLR